MNSGGLVFYESKRTTHNIHIICTKYKLTVYNNIHNTTHAGLYHLLYISMVLWRIALYYYDPGLAVAPYAVA